MINIENNFSFQENDIIVIGCSAGPDSMALVDMLLKIREKYRLSLIIAHVNHNVREQSLIEAEYMKKYCEENKLLFETMTILEYGDDNFENEARNIRYNFFESVVLKYNANYLMTAHHGDDLIETILMRIVRGSTLKGYSGFSRIVQKDNYTLVRPLITVTKAELEDFDKRNNIWYAIDSSNNEDHYTRNRYRHNVLPFLKKEEPNVHKKFLKYSKTLLENNEFIENEANKYFNKVFNNGNLNIDKFIQLEKVLQSKIIYNILEKIYGDDLFVICDAHVELIFNLINSNRSNSIVHLPNNLIVIKSYNEIIFTYDEEQTDEYEIEISNVVSLPNGKIIEKITDCTDTSNNTIRLNSADLTLPLYVRNKRNGDKIEVKGMNGTKKISNIFIDEKIKPSQRSSWPVVLDSKDNIIWLPGLKKSKFDKKISQEYDIILRYR